MHDRPIRVAQGELSAKSESQHASTPPQAARQERLGPSALRDGYDSLACKRGTSMSDYKTSTGHDTTTVEIADGSQVRYWCDCLGCTEAQLREAVQAVGNSPAKVRDFLKTLTQRGLF